MYCTRCGKENNNGEKYCSNCGEPLNNTDTNNQTVNTSTPVNNQNNKGNNKVIAVVLIAVLIIVIGLIIKNVVSYNNNDVNGETFDNEVEENIEDSSLIDINLIDPSTSIFDKCTSSYDNAKYFKKQSDGSYVANVSLKELNAAYKEANCQYETWNAIIPSPKMKIYLNDTLEYKKVNMIIDIPDFTDNSMTSWYIFNDEYIVRLTRYYYIDSFVVFDLKGNKVFDLSDNYQQIDEIEINIDNNEITYKVNCDSRHIDYYNNTTAVFGKVKYNTQTKQFIKDEETKSIDYCS